MLSGKVNIKKIKHKVTGPGRSNPKTRILTFFHAYLRNKVK